MSETRESPRRFTLRRHGSSDAVRSSLRRLGTPSAFGLRRFLVVVVATLPSGSRLRTQLLPLLGGEELPDP